MDVGCSVFFSRGLLDNVRALTAQNAQLLRLMVNLGEFDDLSLSRYLVCAWMLMSSDGVWAKTLRVAGTLPVAVKKGRRGDPVLQEFVASFICNVAVEEGMTPSPVGPLVMLFCFSLIILFYINRSNQADYWRT